VDYNISRNLLCPKCQLARVYEAAGQLNAHKGPMYDQWKKKVKEFAKSLEG
jgi:hypothetical protein